MTEQKKFLKLMRELGVNPFMFKGADYIPEDCKELKAVIGYTIGRYGQEGFYFDSKGKFVGLHGDSIQSFVPRRTK